MARKAARPQPSASRANSIDSILELEKEDERELELHHRVIHAVGWFVGTGYFIAFQGVVAALWISFNKLHATHPWAVDEYPFPLLAMFLSFEAVLLTSCVLIRQNALDRTSERRSHLELEINLLAEKEATRSLELLQRIADHLDISTVKDRQSDELTKDTSVDDIARELKAREKRASKKSS